MGLGCQGFVLTGGRSERMGRDKALLPFGDRPLAAWMAERLRGVCGNVALVGSAAKYSGLGFPVVEDSYRGSGPLAGIQAALHSSPAPYNLIAGCDMPYLHAEFLRWLVERAQAMDAAVTIPESENFGYEPLCGVYTKACLGTIEEALQSGENMVQRVLERLPMLLLPADEWKRYDPEGNLFRNLNTWDAYEQARADLLAYRSVSQSRL